MKWQFFRATITLGNKVREKPEIMTVAAALECLMTIEHDYFGKQRPYVDYTRGSRHNSNLKKEYFTTRDGKRRCTYCCRTNHQLKDCKLLNKPRVKLEKQLEW
eukprot:919788-Amorphochlora_amoeboformis.AAC.2